MLYFLSKNEHIFSHKYPYNFLLVYIYEYHFLAYL